MRLCVSKTKNAASFYVTKTVYVNGKQTTVVVEKLGTFKTIQEKIGEDKDPYEWAKDYVKGLNEKERSEKREVVASLSPVQRIEKGKQQLYNGGYLFLQSIYHELGLDEICAEITKKYRFTFNLDSILSRLIYGRILFPSSKLSTYESAGQFIEKPEFDLHQIYRALEYISKETDFIESSLYKNSIKTTRRSTQILYYDCTNYFFEIEKAEGIKQYGYSKEHRPNPIVQMGMFIDGNGIPLAFSIYDGNSNEQISLKPLEKKIIQDYQLSKFIVCTDAGLASTENRIFNSISNRAFIMSQSLKKLPGFLIDWALSDTGWSLPDQAGTFDLSKINEDEFQNATFYKERWINENNFSQKLIVTFSFKYRNYQQSIRQAQVERANKLVKAPSALLSKRQNDCKRFIRTTYCTTEGEAADSCHYDLNTDLINQEEKFDGFYAVCTNLDDPAPEILKINRKRWEIEDCFRVLKSEFKARPVFLSREDRIRAHFLTCFLALIILRILEQKLDFAFSSAQIISVLQNFSFLDYHNDGFIPTYTRNDLTDALHAVFGFDTDFEIVNSSKMKRIIKLTHSH